MVKYHTYTDRTFRYTERCNKKFKNETYLDIKRKNEEISTLRRSVVENVNKLKRTFGMYRSIYNEYLKIYDGYNSLVDLTTRLKQANENLASTNAELRQTNENLASTNAELRQANENLVNTNFEKNTIKST